MRFLHTMIRVGDLDRSIGFYTGVLGMKLLRRKDYPDGKFTLAFVGYGDESDHAVIELTHNWDTKSYDLGNGFGHIALVPLKIGDLISGNVLSDPHQAYALAFGMVIVIAVAMVIYYVLDRRASRWRRLTQ